MDYRTRRLMTLLGKYYKLILCYGNNSKILMKEIYEASSIVDQYGNAVSYEEILEYNIFMLESNFKYNMIFNNKNNEIIIPLCLVEKIFHSENAIDLDMITINLIRHYLLEEINSVFDTNDLKCIKLDDINATYLTDNVMNNSNYSVIPLRLGDKKIMTELLATMPCKELIKRREKMHK